MYQLNKDNSPNAHRRLLLSGLAGLGVLAASGVSIAHTATGQRVVCIGGDLTEILFALGANDKLVAVDTTSTWPMEVKKLPNVGYARNLSAEGILALNPTLIIATADAGPPPVLKQLQATGIPITHFKEDHSFEGLLSRVKTLGQLTKHADQAKQLSKRLTQEWSNTQKILAKQSTPSPKVLFVLSHAPGQILAAGQHTAADALLNMTKLTNAMQGFSQYKPLTPESLIVAQPDIILLTDLGLKTAGGLDAILNIAGISETPAGRNKRVIAMDAMFLLGFGPRLPQAVAQLHEKIQAMLKDSQKT